MTFLADILARKRDEVEAARRAVPEAELRARTRDRAVPRGFEAALSRRGEPARIIAEVKRASPSAGAIRAGLDAVAQARAYADAGAAAISVLTDGPGFGGSLADLAAVRDAVDVPLLRKDFVVDELPAPRGPRARRGRRPAHRGGARAGDAARASSTRAASSAWPRWWRSHDEAEVETALGAGARIVGVNNRNLKTFAVDLAVSERLLPRLPADVRGVAESGVRTAADARRLRRAGAANLLVGEALVRAADPGALLREMTA